MSAFLEAVRPVLFESDDADYPYFGMGSSVLLSTSRNLYWVTAKHVMHNQHGSAETLRVFATENSRMSIPFNLSVKIVGQSEDSLLTDLYILRATLAEFATSGDAAASSQRIEDGLLEMAALKQGDELLVAGYPNDHRAVNYEDFKIRYTRSVLKANFVGFSSSQQHCGDMRIDTPHGLTTLNGFSGSPIYRLVNVGQFTMPMMVGLAVLANDETGLVRFIDAKVLRHAISVSEKD